MSEGLNFKHYYCYSLSTIHLEKVNGTWFTNKIFLFKVQKKKELKYTDRNSGKYNESKMMTQCNTMCSCFVLFFFLLKSF